MKSEICAMTHGYHLPASTVSNWRLGSLKARYRRDGLMNTSRVASAIPLTLATAPYIHSRNIYASWIRMANIYNGSRAKWRTARESYHSSTTTFWTVFDIFSIRFPTEMIWFTHPDVNTIPRVRGYMRKCIRRTGGGTFK